MRVISLGHGDFHPQPVSAFMEAPENEKSIVCNIRLPIELF